MKSHVFVDNIKCAGCTTTILKKMETIPTISEVDVEIDSGKISFSCQDDKCRLDVISLLKKSGYPVAGTGSKVDAAKSVISCVKGKIDNIIE